MKRAYIFILVVFAMLLTAVPASWGSVIMDLSSPAWTHAKNKKCYTVQYPQDVRVTVWNYSGKRHHRRIQINKPMIINNRHRARRHLKWADCPLKLSSPCTSPTPEPETWMMLGMGLMWLTVLRRRGWGLHKFSMFRRGGAE